MYVAELCNGSTTDFESVCPGSNPGSAAISIEIRLHKERQWAALMTILQIAQRRRSPTRSDPIWLAWRML